MLSGTDWLVSFLTSDLLFSLITVTTTEAASNQLQPELGQTLKVSLIMTVCTAWCQDPL